ncbi:MAG: SDR family NAD(P)-dependent oxidoreductase [Proteobacteria bacterium]|nr:SDR family NAD(P)-dependent oxidoreductase [Pseudomonadota bacterium]
MMVNEKQQSSAFDLTGRVTIVTGGASGIGRAVAQKVSAMGSTIVIADLNDKGGKQVADEIKKNGSKAIFLEIDVSDPAQAEKMVSKAVTAFGRIDALVHSAGIGVESAFLDTSPKVWSSIINVDLSGTFYCCQAVARHMCANHYGRIVTLASTAGIRGGTGRAAYGAAKGGVITLTKVMAVELASFGVTVNALAPGAIETELVAKMHSDETRTVYRRGIPIDRYGTPEEVANVAAFLVSEESRYVTGQIIGVDGGFLAAGIMTGGT